MADDYDKKALRASNLVFDIEDSIMIRDLPEGSVIKLRNESVAEVTGNPHDGGWLMVKILESPTNPEEVGTEDMVFCTDVVGARQMPF